MAQPAASMGAPKQHSSDPTLSFVICAFAVALLVALRVRGDAVLGASYLRAFVERGVLVAVVFLAVWALIQGPRHMCGAPPIRLAALVVVALTGALVNVALTVALAILVDPSLQSRAQDVTRQI